MRNMAIPNNPHIQGAFFKAIGYLDPSKNICVSVSGGSDSDIVVDFIHQCGFSDKVNYLFIDTGLEYIATKNHLDYLESRYDIEIERLKAKQSIPACCKRYGQPFISKYVSHMIDGLQRHGFRFEDKPFETLIEEYPGCKSYLDWWCNKNIKNQWNISYKKYLKEFLIDHPPDFKISSKCCNYAKKNTIHDYNKRNKIDVQVLGLRMAEGGTRATVLNSCYTTSNPDNYRPIWWFTNQDKSEYAKFYGVKYSKCYTEYGFKRTGCACCPFGLDLVDELDKTERHEPKLYRAINSVFGKSYEYTSEYYSYRENKSHSDKRDRMKTPTLDSFIEYYGGSA